MTFGSGEFAPTEKALILRGFDAVPALLKQRHSKRFTNHVMEGFNNFASYSMRAEHVISSYLQRLANQELGCSWLDRQLGYTVEDEAILTWWKNASALGEEAYVRKHTVTLDGEGRASLSPELLLLARGRYPKLLPGLYRRLLKTSLPSWPVADAIMQSELLDREGRVALLQAGIATNHEAHRNSALWWLRTVDPALADAHLVRVLKQAPTTPDQKYWLDQDARLGELVSGSLDPKVWQALHALLDRADLGMRMELINGLEPPRDFPAEILRSFHRVYERFRTDATVRDESTSEKFDGPGAGFPHPRIAMRDFIHEHWACWLELELEAPATNTSAVEWDAYRGAVARAIREDRSKQTVGGDANKSQQ